MIAIAALALTVGVWLTAPTFGADHTQLADFARMTLTYLLVGEVAFRVVPE